MARPTIRLLSVLLLSAAAGFWALQLLPSSAVDRAAVGITARTIARPPFLISGKGTHQDPWSLQVISSDKRAADAKPPLVISLGDDREGIFQSSPPSPIDLAVILQNLRRLGSQQVAISAVMAWDKPDAIALNALDAELSKFQKLATAAPLSRSANATALPPSFRHASLPLDRVNGDTAALPAVNKVALPDVILDGLSGFSILEQEATDDAIPLVARWDDRAVLAFPLVAAISQLGIRMEDIRIDLGNFLRLGTNGPLIPIDEYGRMKAPAVAQAAGELVPAAAMIDRQEPLPDADVLLLLRDDQSAAEAATIAFSKAVAPQIRDILSGAGMSPVRTLDRLPRPFELSALAGVSLLLSLFARASFSAARMTYGILAAIVLIAGVVTLDIHSIWLPTLPSIIAILAGLATCRLLKDLTPALVTPEKSAAAEAPPEKIAVPATEAPAEIEEILPPEPEAPAPPPETPKVEKTVLPEKKTITPTPEAPKVAKTALPEKKATLPGLIVISAASQVPATPPPGKASPEPAITPEKKAAAKQTPAKKAAKKSTAKKAAAKKSTGKKGSRKRSDPPAGS